MSQPFQGATIVFDLDGTLVDTAPDLVAALNAALAPKGFAPHSTQSLRMMVGQGARALIERAAHRAGRAFNSADLDRLTDDFINHYRGAIAVGSRPFPGCLQALDAFAAAGARLAVCTNKRTELARALLDALGMTYRFNTIIGADAAPARKPSPEHFSYTVAQAGGAIARSIMVGDSSADVKAAAAAGRPTILVRFGYHDAPLESLGAAAIIDHFDEVYDAASRLLSGAPGTS
jgi:phosphoglycolate phosphatase